MKRFVLALFAAFVGIGFSVQDAEAKRLGGGSSVGMSRSTAPVQKAAPAPTPAAPAQGAASTVPAKPAAAPQAATPQPSGMSRWLGPIAGLAAGIGLAALLSHFGLGEGVANFLMILLLVMAVVFIVRLLFRKSQSQQHARHAELAPAGGAPMRFEPTSAPVATPAMGGASTDSHASIPAGFDSEGFLRQAKLNFIRLQAANDAGNLDDLKQFLAPQVFAEVQMQFEERGKTKQETDVQQLEAELLEVTTENGQHIASVRFHGTIREDAGPAQPFAEVWHLNKPEDGSRGWQVAGIQQIR